MSTPAPGTAALCFLDTETTGVHPGRQPWEVAMIRREPDGSQREVQFFMDVNLAEADPFGLSVGRFYERHPIGRIIAAGHRMDDDATDRALANTLSRGVAAQTIANMTHGAHLVGAVPSFDAVTLEPLLRSQGYLPGWHYHLIDVEALAAGYIAGVNTDTQLWGKDHPQVAATMRIGYDPRPPWKSRDLVAAIDVPNQPESEKHTAMGDARWAMHIYDTVFNPACWQSL